VLQKANGVIATVGLEADLSQEPTPPGAQPGADARPAEPAMSGQPISDKLPAAPPGANIPPPAVAGPAAGN